MGILWKAAPASAAMTLLARATVTALLFLSLSATAYAHSHKHKPSPHNFFPATHESVPAENRRADAENLPVYVTDGEVTLAVYTGAVVPIWNGEAVYGRMIVDVSQKLPAERQYLRTEANDYLSTLAVQFWIATDHQLTVDSAVRSAETQKRIGRHNKCAAPAYGDFPSSHERGTTFDLARKTLSKRDYNWLVWRLLLDRAHGKILVIEERACFHIFVGSGAQ